MKELLIFLGIFVLSVGLSFFGGVWYGMRREKSKLQSWRKNLPLNNFI